MTILASALMLIGGVIAIFAGIGILRFNTSYARFHAAGKASPVAFLVAAVGASIQLGAGGAATLAIAGVAMILTLPVGVHLLFRAVHRTSTNEHLVTNHLTSAERYQPKPARES